MEAAAGTLTTSGPAYAASGAAVHQEWQGLAPVYTAPEAPTLFAATLPIQDTAAVLGQDVATAGAALTAFAREVLLLQEEARRLMAEAAAVEQEAKSPAVALSAGMDPTGGATDPLAAERDRLLKAAAELMARFNQAEITCANAIRALVGAIPLVANNGDGALADNEYGLTADQWVDAWGGTSLDRSVAGGIATAFMGDLEGVGALLSGDEEAWLGLWRTAAGLGMAATGTLAVGDLVDLPGLPRGSARQALVDAGKGMLAWDEWSKNPANAFGQVLYNFGTLGLAATKVGTGARLAGAAGRGLNALADATTVRVPEIARAAGASLADVRVPALRIDPPTALAGAGRAGLPNVGVGSTRLGDTGVGRLVLPNVTDPPPGSRGRGWAPPDAPTGRSGGGNTPEANAPETDAPANRPDAPVEAKPVDREEARPVDRALIEEARRGGVKMKADEVVQIGRDPNQRIVFLEEGGVNPRTRKEAGLVHVMTHKNQFVAAGIPADRIGEVVHRAATEGRYTGYCQGTPPGRPIFEVEYGGRTHYISVSVGSNGYIVGANHRGFSNPFDDARRDPRADVDTNYRGW
ncbi:hypothetical protein GCM10009634_50430 [Saccharothrix xinjiangensis]